MEANIQVLIKKETPYGLFSDAIYLPISVFDSLSEEEIEAMKEARVQNWIDAITTPPEPPSPEEMVIQLKDQLRDLDMQRADILTQLESLNGE